VTVRYGYGGGEMVAVNGANVIFQLQACRCGMDRYVFEARAKSGYHNNSHMDYKWHMACRMKV